MLDSEKQSADAKGYFLAFCIFGLFVAIYYPMIKSQFKGLSELNLIIYILFLVAVHRLVIKREKISIHPLDYLILLYVIFCFYSVIYSSYVNDFKYSVELIRYKGFLNPFLIYFFLKNSIRNTTQSKLLIDSLIMILVLGAVISLILFLIWPDRFAYGGTRIKGIVNQPALYGLFIVTLSPFLLLAFKSQKKIQKLVKLASIAIVMFALIMTGSRGALLAQFIVFSLIFIESRHKSKAIIRSVLATALILAIIHFAPFEINPIRNRMKFSDTPDLNTYSSGRWSAWQHLLKRSMEAPIIGHGFNSLRRVGLHYSSHNEYINIFFNLGSVGLLLYLLIFSYTWLSLRKHATLIPANAARYSITGYLVCIFFVNPGGSYFFWIMVAIVLRSVDLDEKMDCPSQVRILA